MYRSQRKLESRTVNYTSFYPNWKIKFKSHLHKLINFLKSKLVVPKINWLIDDFTFTKTTYCCSTFHSLFEILYKQHNLLNSSLLFHPRLSLFLFILLSLFATPSVPIPNLIDTPLVSLRQHSITRVYQTVKIWNRLMFIW